MDSVGQPVQSGARDLSEGERAHADHPGLVSVVMIFRDPGPYFAEAIESVLGQTWSHLELVLCDDGSGPEATSIAATYASNRPDKVTYTDHPRHAHRGTGASRNRGIAVSTGEYIAFLDADDVWAPEHLERELARIAHRPDVDAVCGGAINWSSWSDPAAADETPPTAFPVGTVLQPPRMLEALLQRPETATPTCSLIVRASTLRTIGGSDPLFSSMYEDQALLAKLFMTAAVIIGGSSTAFYRQHAASSSVGAISDGFYHPSGPNPARRIWLRWLLDQMRDAGSGPELVALVATELDATSAERTRGAKRIKSVATAALSVRRGGPARRWADAARRRAHRALLRVLPAGPSALRTSDAPNPSFDHYYVERFLTRSAYLIRGHALHRGTDLWPKHVDVATGPPKVRRRASPRTSERYDCIVLTRLPQLELERVVLDLHAALRSGGVALVTVPWWSQVATAPHRAEWIASPALVLQAFARTFGEDHVEMECFGNVRVRTAYLEGFGADRLRRAVLDAADPENPVLVGLRAWRSDGPART